MWFKYVCSWFIVFSAIGFTPGLGYSTYWHHAESEARRHIPRDWTVHVTNKTFDVIRLENFQRSYLTHKESVENPAMFYNQDIIAAYVGPRPKFETLETGVKMLVFRAWAMFDKRTRKRCVLITVFDYGATALFTCTKGGVYRAYAIEYVGESSKAVGDPLEYIDGQIIYVWSKRAQREAFDLLLGGVATQNVFRGMCDKKQQANSGDTDLCDVDERMAAIIKWDRRPTSTNAGLMKHEKDIVVSDPVKVRQNHNCYYWMFTLTVLSRDGFVGRHSDWGTSSSFIKFQLDIWIAEPSAIGFFETFDHETSRIQVSEYSKTITNRFFKTGLEPCIRRAHRAIEIEKKIVFVKGSEESNTIQRTPHWRAIIKVHTDRVISTTSDVGFIIASRQNTGSFHCFVGDTRVFVSLRRFQFVPQNLLTETSVNLAVSNVMSHVEANFKLRLDKIYGHGVNFIGMKGPRRYEPATRRTDIVVRINPCVATEFAISMGGSLYFVEKLFDQGPRNMEKVVLPLFPEAKTDYGRDVPKWERLAYLRVSDVTFTPTHAVILMADGYVILHSSSASFKGLADLKELKKYRPVALVKRRWCARSNTPKVSAMMVPMFNNPGTIVILQIYPTEGSQNIFIPPPESTCLPEGIGFVNKTRNLIVNETEIHCYERVNRTDHDTGLQVPVSARGCPPPRQPKDMSEEKKFVKDSNQTFVHNDPHFPKELFNPATYGIESDLKNFNQAVVYVVENGDFGSRNDEGLLRILTRNGLTAVGAGIDQLPLACVEFTAKEREFLYMLIFSANEIAPIKLGEQTVKPYQLAISTLSIPSYPTQVRLSTDNATDERLKTLTYFPGTIILRTRPFRIAATPSLDPDEHAEITKSLAGESEVDFAPQVFPLDTAITSYVINLGDSVVISSIESRYVRPVYYFPWEVLDTQSHDNDDDLFDNDKPLSLKRATTNFNRTGNLFDIYVSGTSYVSVLWRKKDRHYVMDDDTCLFTDDTDGQTVALGSVLSLEGLREVKMFFRNDNAFQVGMHDNNVVYGIYDVKARSTFFNCKGNLSETANDLDPCIDQPEPVEQRVVDPTTGQVTTVIPPPILACTRENKRYDRPCRDPRFLVRCDENVPIDRNSSDPKERNKICLRVNKGCPKMKPNDEVTATLKSLGDKFPHILPRNGSRAEYCQDINFEDLGCTPKLAPKEDIRSIRFLGTGSYRSYLEGSMDNVKVTHPEALGWDSKLKREEPPICPFASFDVHFKPFDFAEVGYQTRITAELSYYGIGIPAEADLIVEFDQTIGVIVEVTTSVEEERHLTTIHKAVDVTFALTDWLLVQLQDYNPEEKLYIRENRFTFEQLRAREPFKVFSITFRPTIVNLRCVSLSWFQSVTFNVGCNAASTMRLVSEATPLVRIDWSKMEDEDENHFWQRDGDTLKIPKADVHKKEYGNETSTTVKWRKSESGSNHNNNNEPIIKCGIERDAKCTIPRYHLFRNNKVKAGDDIFTIHFQDPLEPIFEQFLTQSSRIVTGNVVIYDMLGQHVGDNTFEITLNKMYAGCYNTETLWYRRFLDKVKQIGGKDDFKQTFEHENLYEHYKNCFSTDASQGDRENSQILYVSPYYFFNRTNRNKIKFMKKRNRIFIFRAAVVNTKYNRFTYCKHLDTFFMVRVVGVSKSRLGLSWWIYMIIFLGVLFVVLGTYFCFKNWCRGTSTTVRRPLPENDIIIN